MPRERSQNREALRGGLAVAGFVAVFLAIFFAADLRSLFTSKDDLYVLMPSASGLSRGGLVWIAGQTVGEVKRIRVQPPGSDSLERVLVHFQVRSRHREHIRRDSQARVTSFRLIGDPVLDISPGDPAAPAVEPGDTLGFRAGRDPTAAMVRARALQESLSGLLAESKIVATRTRDRSAQAERVLNRLTVAARELRDFTYAVQEGPLNTLSDPEFNRVINGLAGTVAELRTSFARSLERAQAARSEAEPALRRLVARTDTIARSVAELQATIDQSGGGLLTRALRDSAIVKALHGAQAQLDSLVAESKRAPWRFWF